MMLGVSVIVCCYNSSKRLPNTLAHLANQKVPGTISWEILIVDNSSTDNTRQVIDELRTHFDLKCPVDVIVASEPGLSNARRKGLEKSRFEYIIFCDDDNWLSPNYVCEAFKILNENVLCGIVGSKILPEFESEKPHWFDEYQMYYSVGERYHCSGDITEVVGTVLGAGMITRKSIWQNVFRSNYKFLCVDRIGNKLSTGGDIEMCAIVRELKLRIYYSNEIYLKHFIPKERLNISYLKRNAFGVGMFYVLIQPYHYLSKKKAIRKSIWIKDLLFNVIRLWKPFVQLMHFKKIGFIVQFYLAKGKVYGLLTLRKQYLENIKYIQSYYASRN